MSTSEKSEFKIKDHPLVFWSIVSFCFCMFFYHDILFQGFVYAFRDNHTILLPMEHVVRELLAEKWVPLWNPYMVLGKPLAAEPLSGIFYPPNWILRIVGEPLSWSISIAVHHLIALLGAVLFLRGRKFSLETSLLGGFLFSFGGLFVSFDNMINALQSAVWLPWAVWAFDKVCARRDSFWIAVCGIFMSLTLLGGMPEVLIFENMLFVGLIIERGLRSGKKFDRLLISSLFIVNLIWILLSAAFLFPFLEYLRLSSRAGGIEATAAVTHSFSFSRLFGFIFQEKLGGGFAFFKPSPEVVSAGTGYAINWAVSLYLGPILVFLTAMKFAGRRLQALIWIGFAVIFLLLSLGGNLPGYEKLISFIPLLRVARYPEKFLLGFHSLLVVGVVYGIECCRSNKDLMGRLIVIGLTAAFCSGAFYLFGCNEPILIFTLLSFAYACAWGILPRKPEFGRYILISFTLVSLLVSNKGIIPVVPWGDLISSPRIMEEIQPKTSLTRIYSNEIEIPYQKAFPEDELLEKELLNKTYANLFGLANLNTPSSLNLAAHNSLIEGIFKQNPVCTVSLLKYFNILYITSFRDLDRYPGLNLLRPKKLPGIPNLYRVENPLPRAYIAEKVVRGETLEDTVSVLCDSSNSLVTAVVSKNRELALPQDPSSGLVLIREYSGDRIKLTAHLNQTGLMVLSDSYYPGWNAFVDGKRQRFIRVNSVVRGLVLKKGLHDIKILYQPKSLLLGLVVSLCSAASLICWMMSRLKIGGRPLV